MVSITENWASVSGEIRSIQRPGDNNSFAEVSLLAVNISPVKGFPNLLRTGPDNSLSVKADATEVEELGLLPGKKITVLVKAVGLNRYQVKRGSIKAAQ
jgi:hypothetical protein